MAGIEFGVFIEVQTCKIEVTDIPQTNKHKGTYFVHIILKNSYNWLTNDLCSFPSSYLIHRESNDGRRKFDDGLDNKWG